MRMAFLLPSLTGKGQGHVHAVHVASKLGTVLRTPEPQVVKTNDISELHRMANHTKT